MGSHHGRHPLLITTAMESMIGTETETDNLLGTGGSRLQEEMMWTHTSRLTSESEWTATNKIVGVEHVVVRRLEVEYMTEVGTEIEDRIVIEAHFRVSITNDKTPRSVTNVVTETIPTTVIVEELLQGPQRTSVTRAARGYLPGALLHTAAAHFPTMIPSADSIYLLPQHRICFATAIKSNTKAPCKICILVHLQGEIISSLKTTESARCREFQNRIYVSTTTNAADPEKRVKPQVIRTRAANSAVLSDGLSYVEEGTHAYAGDSFDPSTFGLPRRSESQTLST